MSRAFDWLDERAGVGGLLHGTLNEPVRGGASFAYIFGSVLTFILLLQMVTGVLLGMYYSPSSTDAWASVAFIQDQVSSGWFIRGLHHYGASAMVVVAALHMVQTAIYGAYRKPRELNWIIGVLMLGLILAFALTGYLLPWDQTGYWATKVATGIAGGAPVVGQSIQQVVQGGNEYGNLTITRFFAIHVFVLPAMLILLTVAHIYLFRRHGATPSWRKSERELEATTEPFWPGQMFRDMVAMAVMFAILIGLNIATHGTGIDAPADPASSFQARPEWYFRPLFQAIEYFEGPMVKLVELGLPVVVGGILIAFPFLDRSPDRAPKKRLAILSVLAVGMVIACALTVVSFLADAGDPAYQKQEQQSAERAALARKLARTVGVPAAGGYAVFAHANSLKPFASAKKRWASDCAGCHAGEERSGPEIGPGYNSRTWIRGFLLNPSGPRFFGQTSISGMKPVTGTSAKLNALTEFIYAQTGALDTDAALARVGKTLFADGDCSNCHEIDGKSDGTGPNLGGRGTVANLAELIGRPSHPKFFGDKNEMPDTYDKYNRAERVEIAKWLVSLRGKKFPAKGIVQKKRREQSSQSDSGVNDIGVNDAGLNDGADVPDTEDADPAEGFY